MIYEGGCDQFPPVDVSGGNSLKNSVLPVSWVFQRNECTVA